MKVDASLEQDIWECLAGEREELRFAVAFNQQPPSTPSWMSQSVVFAADRLGWHCSSLLTYCTAAISCRGQRHARLVHARPIASVLFAALNAIALRLDSVYHVFRSYPLQGQLLDSRQSLRVPAPRANLVSGASAAPVIAVFDTGVDDPSELLPSAAHSIDKVGKEDDPCDLNGHGTTVATVALGRAKGASPAGICPTCGLADVRVLNAEGQGDANTVAWALEQLTKWNVNAKHKVRVVVMAFAADKDSLGDDPLSQQIDLAFRDHGILTVSAIGNRPTRLVPTPAAASCGLAVGGVDTRETGTGRALASGGRIVEVPGGRDDDKWWRFSSEGPRLSPFIPDPDACPNGHLKPDVVAPAVNVCVPLASNPSSCQPRDGTSMAAALVAGAAGLLFATYPKASAADVANALRNTACFRGADCKPREPEDWNAMTGYGMVDVQAARASLKTQQKEQGKKCID